MTGNDTSAVWLNIFDDVLDRVVVAFVSFLHGVPYRRFIVVLFGESSFLIHVCASDQLDSEIVAKDLRSLNFISNDLLHSLEIALVAIHDYGFVSDIEFMSELLSERLDSSLHEGFLSFYVQHAVLLRSMFGDVGGLFCEVFKYLQILCRYTNTASD